LGEQPSNAGLHGLAAHKLHSTNVTICLVGFYPAFSPLFNCKQLNGYFLLHCYTFSDIFLLRSVMLCAARTFLSVTSDRTTCWCKDKKIVFIFYELLFD